MNKLAFLLPLFILISATAQAGKGGGGSTTVGNGGYSIQCTENAPLQSYDFLITQKEMGKDFQVSPVSGYYDSLWRIRDLIAQKLPALSNSFVEFINEINTENFSNHYVWRSLAPWLLNPGYFDSNHVAEICPDAPTLATLSLVILRETLPASDGEKVFFYYDGLQYNQLSDVHRSFLLVHEWLWNFTDDYISNSRADYLLHSTWIETATSEEVIRKFKELGIQFPVKGY